MYNVLIRLIATTISPILYAFETWTTTKSDENKLSVFERKIFRKNFVPKKNDEGDNEIRTNEELSRFFGEDPTLKES